MKKLYFEVTLLSDVIINQKAATEGPNATLDFIPGSNFMGIVASDVYAEIKKLDDNKEDAESLKKMAMDLFHNGKTHFGDAHLGKEGIRSHKVPASMYYPKLGKASEKLYINHLIPSTKEVQEALRKEQPKQCRTGFYLFTGDAYEPVKTDTAFAIKSAHDRETRTSKKAQLFGYESMTTDHVLYFEVDCPEEYAERIKESLTKGVKRVGRSRSSQYGLVEIKSIDSYQEVKSVSKKGEVAIYADSRLVFLNAESGLPTFRPTEAQLGLTSGKIAWEKSQVRIFQYSPWNFKRQCFDTDRCGIEKGSVLVVEGVEDCPAETQYIGSYTNEGFGRVIYNPSFLEGDPKIGLAKHTLADAKIEKQNPVEVKFSRNDSILVAYLKEKHFDEIDEQFVYKQVRTWENKYAGKFQGNEAFASQWGVIRQLATQFTTRNEIMDQIFNKTKTVKGFDRFGQRTEKTEPNAYLTHGVAKDKWKGDRLDVFRNFCEEDLKDLNDRFFRMAIINLAAEMGKRCRKENVR